MNGPTGDLARETLRRLIEANRAGFDQQLPPVGQVRRRLQALEAALADAAKRTDALQARAQALQASTSWRVTGPVRWLGGMASRLRGRPPADPPPGPSQPAELTPLAGTPSYEDWIAAEEPGVMAALLPAAAALPDAAAPTFGLVLIGADETPPGLPGLPVRMVPADAPPGPAVAAALDHLATAFVGFLDARDRLAPDAIAIVRAALAAEPQLDTLFADEDRLDAEGRRVRPFFKPGWDPELQRGRDLLGAFTVHRTALVREVLAERAADGPGWRRDLAGRIAAASEPSRIRHVPAVLCHRAAPERAWNRTAYALPEPAPPVSVVIVTRDRPEALRTAARGVLQATDYPALELIVADGGAGDDAAAALAAMSGDRRLRVLRRPGPGGWPALANAAAAEASGAVLVLLHDDIAVTEPGWLRALAAHALQPEVGVVGAKLLYPDGRVQHAGLTVDADGVPRALLRHAADDGEGPFGMLALPRSAWAVSGACLAVRRSTLAEAGGLNESLAAHADIELCLRLAACGYRTAWTPLAALEHREGAAQAAAGGAALDRLVRDWGRLALHDPYLNPNLDIVDEQPRFRGPRERPAAQERGSQAGSHAGSHAGSPAGPPPVATEAWADPAAAAQARRDRLRLAEAQAEIARLRTALALAGQRGPRRVFHELPAPMQRAARRVLRPRNAPAVAEATAGVAAPARGLALVIDHCWPRPDRDSGSVDIMNALDSLRALGFIVVFAATREFTEPSAARDRLGQTGVRCLGPDDAASVEDYLDRHGAEVDLCMLCRVFCGGTFLERVQRACGKARIVFNSIDLNFVREERKARVTGDQKLLDIAGELRAREEHVIRASDATMVVSTAELELLAATMPECYAVRMPLARPIRPPRAPFAERRGVGFIGGFAHSPNVDAIRHFLAATWPLVLGHMPECELSIVGADLPQGLLDGCPGRVRALGQVQDVGPWFESLRLTVAPLRFGAGAKGKVASSLAAGVPCVVSPVAAEGMALDQDAGVLVAATPGAFAACIRDVHTDAALWQGLSDGGLAYARQNLSLDGWRGRLDAMLRRIGL